MVPITFGSYSIILASSDVILFIMLLAFIYKRINLFFFISFGLFVYLISISYFVQYVLCENYLRCRYLMYLFIVQLQMVCLLLNIIQLSIVNLLHLSNIQFKP